MANEHLEPASFQKARAFSALQVAGVNGSGADAKAENEEGRWKNEEVAASSPVCDQQLGNKDGRMKKEELGDLQPTAPAYLETLLNALKRGQEAGDPDGTILLTEEEMHRLLNDPDFCRFEPEMAENLRRIINDSG